MIDLSKKLISEVSKTIIEYDLIKEGDKIAVGLSGGKDSFTLLHLLERAKKVAPFDFEILAITVGYGMGEDFSKQTAHLEKHNIPYIFRDTKIYERSEETIRENSSFCSYFSRMRRGVLYAVAKEHGCNKLALGHHLDDAAESFFMNMFNNGKLRAMAPIYVTDDGSLEVIRPLIKTREHKLLECAKHNNFPIVGDEGCPAFKKPTKMPHMRAHMKEFLNQLDREQKDLFPMLKRSFSNIQPESFSDNEYLTRK